MFSHGWLTILYMSIEPWRKKLTTENLDIRFKQRLSNFQKALQLYGEAISQNMTRLEDEGMIQRFEYTFELAWKCLQDLLQDFNSSFSKLMRC